LVVAGAGPEEYVNELREYAYNVGVSDHIIFTGFINNPNRLISSLDLLVAPSCVDAFGRTIVEAMLQKTPVLAAKSGGHLNIISEGVNGMFYDPTIEGDFIKEFSIIMRKRNVNALSNKAYYFAQDNFSSTQHLNNMLLVYNHLLIS
jgi:glycosyltransferase involved in cell wall biosynthesis